MVHTSLHHYLLASWGYQTTCNAGECKRLDWQPKWIYCQCPQPPWTYCPPHSRADMKTPYICGNVETLCWNAGWCTGACTSPCGSSVLCKHLGIWTCTQIPAASISSSWNHKVRLHVHNSLLTKSRDSQEHAAGLWAPTYFSSVYFNITGKNTWIPANWYVYLPIKINMKLNTQ